MNEGQGGGSDTQKEAGEKNVIFYRYMCYNIALPMLFMLLILHRNTASICNVVKELIIDFCSQIPSHRTRHSSHVAIFMMRISDLNESL